MKLHAGDKHIGTVVSIEPYGAVLKFNDNRTQLLHISHMSDDFVSNVGDVLQVGEQVEVFVVPGKVKDLELTIRQSEIDAYNEDDRPFSELLNEYPPDPKEIRYKDRYSMQKKPNNHRKKKRK
ncbi:MAG: S1 RNA-binding domain-containing protein [Bacteroidaceae bacterium]|nr:S1 RNA-binding domain-containing protein [Bacteroidaceae bacterium]